MGKIIVNPKHPDLLIWNLGNAVRCPIGSNSTRCRRNTYKIS